MSSSMGLVGLAKKRNISNVADYLATFTHFDTEECKNLIGLFDNISTSGKVDRLRFRDFLFICFDITHDVMLDLTFHAFDRKAKCISHESDLIIFPLLDYLQLYEIQQKQIYVSVYLDNDGAIDEIEFVKGLSIMVRGDMEELTEFVYFCYDINSDGSLGREELLQCLKGCFTAGFGLDVEDIDDAERDIVDMVMKKLDFDKDGQITYEDFQMSVRVNPLLLQALGKCLPTSKAMGSFLATITEDFRAYSNAWNEGNHATKRSSIFGRKKLEEIGMPSSVQFHKFKV